MYILNAEGKIIKFTGGKKSVLEIVAFPEIAGATKIVASPNLQNIYILDPQNKRIVIANQKGQLQSQIINESFSNLVDLVLSPGEKTGFAISQNRLFQIEF